MCIPRPLHRSAPTERHDAFHPKRRLWQRATQKTRNQKLHFVHSFPRLTRQSPNDHRFLDPQNSAPIWLVPIGSQKEDHWAWVCSEQPKNHSGQISPDLHAELCIKICVRSALAIWSAGARKAGNVLNESTWAVFRFIDLAIRLNLRTTQEFSAKLVLILAKLRGVKFEFYEA